MKLNIDTLLQHTYTVTDFNRRVRLLKLVQSLVVQPYGTSGDKINSALKEKGATTADLNFISQLDNYELPGEEPSVVRIFLPFKASQAQVKEICSWFRNNVEHNAVLDLQYKVNLLAGAAFVWKGKKADYSLTANNKHVQVLKRLVSDCGKQV